MSLKTTNIVDRFMSELYLFLHWKVRKQIAELERQIKTLKTDQLVTSKSAHYHMLRCRELEQANEAANGMIGELSNQLSLAMNKLDRIYRTALISNPENPVNRQYLIDQTKP